MIFRVSKSHQSFSKFTNDLPIKKIYLLQPNTTKDQTFIISFVKIYKKQNYFGCQPKVSKPKIK